MSENTIGLGAIKIECFQTTPGDEVPVKIQLEEACKSPSIKDYAIFKGLGTFDIILVYLTDNFSQNLREYGPIRNIIKSNTLLCFSYANKKPEDIFSLIKNKVFTSFCMLKIYPAIRKDFRNIDPALRSYLKDNASLSLLGSLGWNEHIILISTDTIHDIYNHIFQFSKLYYKHNDQVRISVALKTLSFIGINYKYLPTDVDIKQGYNKILEILSVTTGMNKPINSPNLQIAPSIAITASSNFQTKIRDYFTDKGFRFSYVIGKTDMVVDPPDDMKWSSFIASLLWCRYKYRKHIFSTYTQIGYNIDDQSSVRIKDRTVKTMPFDFKYARLKDIFGPKMSSYLSNLFYTLNSLFENPLCGSTYSDMLKYPDYVLNMGEAIKNAGASNESFAIASGYVIGRGAELRSYGTYDTIEEVTGRFSEVKGGCHLSVLAMELFPKTIINDWQGFITVTGEPKFSHIFQVINVTTESLWCPKKWWALYHEIAHVIIENNKHLLDRNDPIIDNYLRPRDDKTAYEELLEITAEIMGFELGFFQDFKLFFELLWTYLVDLVPYYNVPLEHYAIRSFILELFESHFRKNRQLHKITKEDWTNADCLYELFMKHMQRIESQFPKVSFENNKTFIAANNVKKIRDIYPVCRKLAKDITDLEIIPSKEHIAFENTNQVVRSILLGRIWWNDISCPRAVLFRLLKTRNLKFNAEIATILSFWSKGNILGY